MRRSPKPIMGVVAPAPRITGRAVWLALRLVGFPLLAALVALDVLVWWLADALWNVCVGVWCWF